MPDETNIVLTIKVSRNKETNEHKTYTDLVTNKLTQTAICHIILELEQLKYRFMELSASDDCNDEIAIAYPDDDEDDDEEGSGGQESGFCKT